MPLGLTMHGKWDGISMTSPPLHSYKHERPAYSTPQPVENTPANNECRMVELRGAKVASFFVGGDEFICLPQAFDLFLKHLVGGLHTVYTKLKRLSIAPVVCNVEQVRILRGLGAIQPGVNRCKLITRKDFEILYQDCTQASRPGRPPKRYPMLPPTTDLMSHHAGMRSMTAAHGMLSASDLNNLHKRMRLDQDLDKHIHQRQERRMSDSPTKDSPPLGGKDLSIPGSNDMHANAANLYLQAQQALRQQYQQVAASGMHNGLDPQHAAAAAGLNPALAPLMMMSHPGLFPGGLPPSSMTMLNHINQFAQNHGSGNAVSSAAAAAAAQIAANGGNMHQQAAAAQAAYQVAAAAQSAAQASLAAAATAHNSSSRDENRPRSSSVQDEKDSDCEEVHTPSLSAINHVNASGLTNGIGSDGCASPHSSISSALGGENVSEGSLSVHSDSADSNKDIADINENSHPASVGSGLRDADSSASHSHHRAGDGANEGEDEAATLPEDAFSAHGEVQALGGSSNISSMQTLLTNIQGLLKVAADNARLQEKHCSFEIADLKARVSKERQVRSSVEKKLLESERIRALIQKRLKKERKVRKLLQEQLLSMQRQLGHETDVPTGKIATAPATPITGALASGRDTSAPISPTTTPISTAATNQQYSPQSSVNYSAVSSPSSANDNTTSSLIAYSKAVASTASSPVSSPTVMSPLTVGGATPFLNARMVTAGSNSNNSSNNGALSPIRGTQANAMPPAQYSANRRPSIGEQDITMDLGMPKRDHVDHPPIPDPRIFFNASRFQTTASQ